MLIIFNLLFKDSIRNLRAQALHALELLARVEMRRPFLRDLRVD
jgi:hypothetical protein